MSYASILYKILKNLALLLTKALQPSAGLDTIFSNLSLPNTMSEDDRVYIESTGAYTICFASVFNGFKPPKVYFIDSSLK